LCRGIGRTSLRTFSRRLLSPQLPGARGGVEPGRPAPPGRSRADAGCGHRHFAARPRRRARAQRPAIAGAADAGRPRARLAAVMRLPSRTCSANSRDQFRTERACPSRCLLGRRVLINRDCSPIAGCRKRRVRIGSSGDFLTPSPPGEKATASQDQARQSHTDDGTGRATFHWSV
jgi:hypothetical protein